MDTLMQSQVFFFISSVGFVMLWILGAICLYYMIKAFATFSRIMDKVEQNINHIGDATQEILEEIRDSTIFNFLLKKKKKTNSK